MLQVGQILDTAFWTAEENPLAVNAINKLRPKRHTHFFHSFLCCRSIDRCHYSQGISCLVCINATSISAINILTWQNSDRSFVQKHQIQRGQITSQNHWFLLSKGTRERSCLSVAKYFCNLTCLLPFIKSITGALFIKLLSLQEGGNRKTKQLSYYPGGKTATYSFIKCI